MNINTAAIRRLRDQLFSSLSEGNTSGKSLDAVQTALRESIRRRVEPFAETMYLVMVADGDRASVEFTALVAAVEVLTDGHLSANEVEGMLVQFDGNARRDGNEARLAQLGDRISGDRDDRETAFMLGAVVALADDRVDVRENAVLEWIRLYYGISQRRVDALLQAVACD